MRQYKLRWRCAVASVFAHGCFAPPFLGARGRSRLDPRLKTPRMVDLLVPWLDMVLSA
jgi:hypothetical protein